MLMLHSVLVDVSWLLVGVQLMLCLRFLAEPCWLMPCFNCEHLPLDMNNCADGHQPGWLRARSSNSLPFPSPFWARLILKVNHPVQRKWGADQVGETAPQPLPLGTTSRESMRPISDSPHQDTGRVLKVEHALTRMGWQFFQFQTILVGDCWTPSPCNCCIEKHNCGI